MIGQCEVNLGGCHEGESSEPMPALTLGQGVEQNFQRVIRNSTNDKIGILSHEGNGHGNLTWRHEHAQKSAKRTGIVPKPGKFGFFSLTLGGLLPGCS